VLGLGLAVLAIGGVTGVAYLLSRMQYQLPASGPKAGGGAYEQTPDDQLVPEPPDAELTDPQQGASNVKEAIDAQEDANSELAPDRRRDPFDDDPDAVGPGVDRVSNNGIGGVASFLAMATGYVEEDNPEYQGPPIY
jgi:hypothetical protein